jgi:hypothetical protein
MLGGVTPHVSRSCPSACATGLIGHNQRLDGNPYRANVARARSFAYEPNAGDETDSPAAVPQVEL